ncbi:MFS transporter [Nocardia sp. alder85J]|uniref:MFS transporter n=1 Tax=Nocardia sp. alder85J TaxID=2862949 RepID=UPI001CD32AA9|nr:MFS transporter [Nocardia sp. alder85J]MCX4090969.1 MFS transporter [Nocardia sp. alder85J]
MSAVRIHLRGTATPRLGLSLTLLALAQLIFSLDLNIVYVALPEIGRALGFSQQTQQWVVSSLAGGLAGAPAVVIVARAVQGVGGALLLPSTLSLIGTLFEEGPARNRALAAWGGAGAAGLTVGALLGGLLTQAFGWSAVFFVNVPLAGLVAVAALVVVPRDPRGRRSRRFDIPGAVTVTSGATLLVFALVQGPELGWSAPVVVGAGGFAAALFGTFVTIEARSADPLVPFRLFRNRSLVVGVLATAIYMATFGTLPYFLTVLFQSVHRYSALRTGLVFLMPSIAIATGTQLGERLTTRLGTRVTLALGFGIGVIGTAVLALGFSASATLPAAVPGLILSGIGQGTTWTAMWIAAAVSVSRDEQGVANGMASTALNLGNAIGLAVLVAIAGAGLSGRTGAALRTGLADGSRTAVLLAAAGIVLGSLVSLTLPRPVAPARVAAPTVP